MHLSICSAFTGFTGSKLSVKSLKIIVDYLDQSFLLRNVHLSASHFLVSSHFLRLKTKPFSLIHFLSHLLAFVSVFSETEVCVTVYIYFARSGWRYDSLTIAASSIAR